MWILKSDFKGRHLNAKAIQVFEFKENLPSA